MKHTQSNFLYHAQFDGTILKYQLKSWVRGVFKLLGLRNQLELPLNVVLSYQVRHKLFALECFQFTVYHHNYLSNCDKLQTSNIKGLVFVSLSKSSFSRSLQQSLDKNIRETKEGKNIGLLNVPIDLIRNHYSEGSTIVEKGFIKDSKKLMVSSRGRLFYRIQKHVK